MTRLMINYEICKHRGENNRIFLIIKFELLFHPLFHDCTTNTHTHSKQKQNVEECASGCKFASNQFFLFFYRTLTSDYQCIPSQIFQNAYKEKNKAKSNPKCRDKLLLCLQRTQQFIKLYNSQRSFLWIQGHLKPQEKEYSLYVEQKDQIKIIDLPNYQDIIKYK